MCLVAIALRAHPRFPLVVAANRDEFYARPTRPAGWWPDARQVWAGQDLEGGGTWMGVTRAGRFALLTNVRELDHLREGAVTRGALVAAFLDGDAPPEAYLQAVAGERERYNGFNLVCGTLADTPALWALHHGERRPERAGQIEHIAVGLHGLSNAALDVPWPKTTGLKDDVQTALGVEGLQVKDLVELLFAALADRTEAPDGRLPDTGVGLEWEQRLSARFIAGGDYGTRASTVLLVEHTGMVWAEERRFEAGGARTGHSRSRWSLGE